MSNRIVPATYRAIIDDVMASVKADFEDAGVELEVLLELQNKWEMKVVASRVAQFEPAPPSPPPQLARLPPPPPLGYIKTEPVENSFGPPHPMNGSGLNGPPDLSGLLLPNRPPPPPLPPVAVQRPMMYPATPQLLNGAPPGVPPASSSTGGLHVNGNGNGKHSHSTSPAGPSRLPGLDGAESDHSSSESSSSPMHHPTPKKPVAKPPKPQKPRPPPGNDEEIGSDLDDSDEDEIGDDEGEEGGGARDSVLCTYDKVQRVKNKWKCVLKDGIMHVNGRDYLFSKCTGEFEW